MTRTFTKILAVVLAAAMLCGLCVTAYAEEEQPVLKFNNGKLKIVVFADTQDDSFPDGRMVQMINDALDAEKPDLVVFTGDNVVQGVKPLNIAGIDQIIAPVAERGIPFAVTFGNHDGEHFSKEAMLSFYQRYDGCLSYDADPELTGVGTCNIPVYSSDGTEIAYNLWMIDSNMYDEENGGYDYVHQDQIDWYIRTSEALEEQAGHKVPSMVFQHIVVPEVFNCLREATEEDTAVHTYQGKSYALELNDTAEGYLGEFPCPPTVNGGEFDAFLSRGDVVGIVTGHDHVNSFVGAYEGISFIQFPGATFQSYGNDEIRGYGVLTIDEANPDTFEAHSVKYADMYASQSAGEEFMVRVQAFMNSLKLVFRNILDSFKELFAMLAQK